MNKLELIQALKGRHMTCPNPKLPAVVDIFFNGMADALACGDRVEIRGLCSFFVKEYGAYIGRESEKPAKR